MTTSPTTGDTCRGCGKYTAMLTPDHRCNPAPVVDDLTMRARRSLAQNGHDVEAATKILAKSIRPRDMPAVLAIILPVWVRHVDDQWSAEAATRPSLRRVAGKAASPKPSRKWAHVAESIMDQKVLVNRHRIRIGDLTATDCQALAAAHHTRAQAQTVKATAWEKLSAALAEDGARRVGDLDKEFVEGILG